MFFETSIIWLSTYVALQKFSKHYFYELSKWIGQSMASLVLTRTAIYSWSFPSISIWLHWPFMRHCFWEIFLDFGGLENFFQVYLQFKTYPWDTNTRHFGYMIETGKMKSYADCSQCDISTILNIMLHMVHILHMVTHDIYRLQWSEQFLSIYFTVH